ncbi:MAG: 16S rRNA (guanine(966)-N(2))-methyltransferase RsmD [Betaproteobacteria bacterium]|nr:16S rRNA (guanine(966)-N(2))-methyltransferase RsmD [Betaproteobacteria bacterium]
MHSNKGNRGPAAGTLRVIGGKYRSRQIRVPARPGLRPTPGRVRETLFNWLGQDLDGLACLDLYAGSGALGFEAASRGAAPVVLVEKDRAVVAELERSRAALGATQLEIVCGDAATWLARERRHYDVVFLDPPFRQNAVPAILGNLPPRLNPGARVYVEAEAPIDVAAPWTELKCARAGQVSYQLLQWNPNEGQP